METLSQPHESSIQKPETAAMMALVRFAEISKAIQANLPLDAILGQIVTALKPLVGCNMCAVGLFDATRHGIDLRIADESPSWRVGMLLPVAEFPIIEQILKSGDLFYVPKTDQSSLWQQKPLFLNSAAFIGMPLSIDKEVLGIFFMGYPATDPLTEEMRFTLLAFAQQAVTAIQNSRQHEQQRSTQERYHLIADLTSEAVYEYDPMSDDISWSEGLDRLLRYPQGSFPRSREAWVAAIHPDDRERVRLALDHAINQFAPFKEEYRVRRHDGAYCVVLDRATRFRSYAHEPHESRVIGAISDMTQTYELADALLDSETRYRTVFERALDAIFVTDFDGNFIDVNPAAEVLTGHTYAKLLSMSMRDLAVSDQIDDYVDAFDLLRRKGEFPVREMVLCRYDTSTVYIEMWATALGDNIFQIVVRDVTSRRVAQEQSQQRAAELMALSDVTRVATAGGDLNDMLRRVLPDAMNALDATMGCIYLRESNTTVLRLVAQAGYNTESYPARTLNLTAANRGRQTDTSTLVRVVDHATALNSRSVGISLQVPLVANDRVLGLVMFSEPTSRSFTQTDIQLMDIIGRQLGIGIENVRLLDNLEQLIEERTTALSATEARYRSLIEQVPGVVYTADSVYDGLSFISAGTENLFGYAPDEMIVPGSSLLTLINVEDVSWVQDRADNSITTGKDFDAQYRIASNGIATERWVHHRARLILAETGETFWLGLITDVTELKELDRLKSQFVSTVTHELRTPLTAIKLRAATLNNYYARLTDDQRLDAVRRITHQSDILAGLIEDVLRLAKLDADNIDRQIEVIDLVEIGMSVTEELRPSLEEANLTLDENWTRPRLPVRADKTDFFIVWRNLIGNAIKYTKGPGSVTLCAGYVRVADDKAILSSTLPERFNTILPGILPGDWVVALVKDTGKGISEEDQAHIYTRFYRGEAALSNVPGSGLGLSLVKELLDDYGGHIGLHSQLGGGSTFVFWLPAVEQLGSEH